MLRQALESYFNQRWYQRQAKHWFWSPLAGFYEKKVTEKRNKFLETKAADSSSNSLPPVLVVGNITVGGTGKTPVVIHLVEALTKQGLKVAVISRGYGGKAESYPAQVTSESAPEAVGDEPFMVFQRTGAMVVVDPDRKQALEWVVAQGDFDLVISDDGLQHYALDRQYEIVVIDGERGLGNQACLPAGPLREPFERLSSVDAIVINGTASSSLNTQLNTLSSPVFSMSLQPTGFVPLTADAKGALPLEAFASESGINAIAAIGNPQRFFDTLSRLGLSPNTHAFPDHHPFSAADLKSFEGKTLLMTEKDAVKIKQVLGHEALSQCYFLSVSANIDDGLINDILARIKHN